MAELSDFRPSDAVSQGARGLVPTPPPSTEYLVLTHRGWKPASAVAFPDSAGKTTTSANRRIFRGTEVPFAVTVQRDEFGELVASLAAFKLNFYVKTDPDALDSAALLSRRTVDANVVATGNRFLFSLSAADTSDLMVGRLYHFVIKITSAAGNTVVADIGTIYVAG